MRNKHSKKEVEEAIVYAESHGWTVESASGHPWGTLKCSHNDKECRCGRFCRMSVWSTPKNPGNHAKQLKTRVDNCIHENGDDNGNV
ncbi:MAG: hypothetical protein OQK78_01375 [Gammaproteobacteria bacterium]|nr:hypothetical protein [Gammaproteobacteria bacterium]